MLPIENLSAKDCWAQSKIGSNYQCTTEYLGRLRSAIRKERGEFWGPWRDSLALLIGALGALIGLVSALKK
jgi:hypothetical protein